MDVIKRALVGVCIVGLGIVGAPAIAAPVDSEPDADLVEVGAAVADSGVAGAADPEQPDGSDSASTATVVVPVTDEPLTVYVAEDVSGYAVSGSGYTGMIGSQYVDYFAGIAARYWGRDYVLYRANQYSYVLVYNADLQLSGTTFTGSGDVVTFISDYSDTRLTFQSSQRVNLNLQNVSCYSSLGAYPELPGVNKYEKVASLTIIIAGVCSFVFALLFGRVRR